MAEEGIKKTDNKLIHIGKPIPFDTVTFLHQLEELAEASYENSEHIVEMVEQIVSTFHPVGEHPDGIRHINSNIIHIDQKTESVANVAAMQEVHSAK